MKTIEDTQVPTFLCCKVAEPIKSPKAEEKSPRRKPKLFRMFPEETSYDKNPKQMNIIEERQVPTTLNCKEAEPIKSPKTEEKSPRRAAKLLRRFSEETLYALTRIAKS